MAETTKNDEPPDLRDQKAFREWLESKPREWSVVIAARAALRVLPLARTAKFGSEEARAILLPVFRATAIARFATVYPNRAFGAASGEAFESAAQAATDTTNAAADTAYAAYAAAAAATDAATDAASAAAAALAAAGDAAIIAAGPKASIAVLQDALALTDGVSPDQVARDFLWKAGDGVVFPSGFPPRDKMAQRWSDLRGHLVQLGKHWQVWIDWYNDVLIPPMPSRGEAWEAAFTNVQHPSYPWKTSLPWGDGPEKVNLAIKARLDSLQAAARISGESTLTADASVVPPQVPQPITFPDQTPAPVRVEERNGKIARIHDRDSPLRAAERDFNAWREPVIDHIEELTSGDFRDGTNHSRARDRLVALGDLLPGDIAEVKEQQFRIGYEIERFEGLIAAYRSGGDDMPVLTAASLEDLDRLRIALKMGVDKLERWAEFRRAATDDPRREGDAKPETVSEALDHMAEKMEGQPKYFDPALPASFRFLAEAAKDKIGATKTVVYGAVKSAENLISFLGQRALGIGKNAIEGVEKHISKAAATTLLIGLGGAALKLSSALPQSWAWLKPLLEALSKVGGG